MPPLIIIISGLPQTQPSRFHIREASSPPSSCWARNERCGTDPDSKKINEMNGAHLASPIRGELAWLCSLAPAGNPIYCPIGHQIWGPLGKQDLCPNGCQISVQQFGQL